MVGINEDEFFKKYDDQISTPKNLSIIFEGPQSDVFRYFKNADLLVNLFDTKQSGECIGITAQESLCMGVPVVIPSEGLSDFKLEPGIYHDKDFLDSNLNTSSIYPSYILNKLFKGDLHLNNQEIGYWREKTSRKRYNRDLLNFIKTIENL
jgi:hypothetical protein